MGVYEALTSNPQAALNQAALEPGSTVVFTAGLYYPLPESLVVRPDTNIQAYGAFIVGVDSNHVLLRSFEPSDSFPTYDGPSDITVHGGVWDARAHDQPSAMLLNAFNFCHGSRIRVQDAIIRNVNGAHAIEFAAIRNGTINNCRFEGFYDPGEREFSEAIQLDWPDNSESTSIGLWDDTPCKGIIVSQCYMGPSSILPAFGSLIGSHAGFPPLRHRRIRITNCEVVSSIQYGIRTWGWADVVISGNQIDFSQGSSILVQHSNDVIVANNNVTSAGRNGINVSGSQRAIVTANTVKHTEDQYGVWLGKVDGEGSGTTDSLVTNNIISGADISSIRLSAGVNRCVITDNMLRRDGGGQTAISADAGNGTVNKVARNYIHGFATPLAHNSGTIEQT